MRDSWDYWCETLSERVWVTELRAGAGNDKPTNEQFSTCVCVVHVDVLVLVHLFVWCQLRCW